MASSVMRLSSYAANNLVGNRSSNFNYQGVTWFDGSLAAGAAIQVNDAPTSAWWHILRFNHSNNNEYYTDVAVPFNNNGLYYKIIRANAVVGGKWHKVIDTDNVSSTLYWANVPVSTASSTATQPTVNTIYASNWFRSTGATGWYHQTYGGGWYMTDTNWIRNYNSKPLYMSIGAHNAWGIGGHRLALGLQGDSHVSLMLLVTDNVGYGLCANSNGNWYFGKRTSKSMTSTSGDAYFLYGNNTFLYPSTNNSLALGGASNRFSSIYTYILNTASLASFTNGINVYTTSAGANGYTTSGSAIEIREVSLVTTNQDAWTYAPKVGFHWGGRYQGTLGLHSNGQFYFGLSGGQANVAVHTGSLYADAGNIYATANGNTMRIGSQNTSFCHITNSADIPFWFNKSIYMENGKTIGAAGTTYRPYQLYLGRTATAGSNAINAANPLIEFSNSDRSQYCQLIYSDYDSIVAPDSLTLIGNQAGTHFIAPKVNVGGYINNSYTLSTASFICNSWIRTIGNTGWYNESYGGGWYMVDSTYIRNYGSKQVYINAQLDVDATLRLWNNTRQITRASRSVSWISGRDSALMREDDASGYHAVIMTKTGNGCWSIGNYNASGWTNYLCFSYTTDANYNAGTNAATTIRMRDNGVVESAMWNDYAEYRQSDIVEPGRVVIETGNDDMTLCKNRLIAGAKVVSDTYGFAIGQTKKCNAPIAVSGRVLVYPYKDRNRFKPGDAVCSAPGGTVDIMTRREIIMYPERIIGTVSAVPNYDIWYGGGNYGESDELTPIQVNGRIWIYVR